MAAPSAERLLANGLVKLKGKKNFFFGHIYVGTSKEEAEQI
jgi:hypothetical protein